MEVGSDTVPPVVPDRIVPTRTHVGYIRGKEETKGIDGVYEIYMERSWGI
jgi:hypothetical protein